MRRCFQLALFFIACYSIQNTHFPKLLGGQGGQDPVVAKETLKLRVGGQIVDTVERGELLSVLEEREDTFAVITSRGRRAVVSKAYTVRLSDAVEVYDKLLLLDAQDSRLYILRANAWWARGELERALEDFNRAIERGHDQADGYTSRGTCLAALERFEDAVRDHTYAIKLDPQYEAAYVNRAAAYMAQRKFEEALKDYSEAIGLNGNRASTFQQRAVAWKQVGITDKAIEDFGKALELNPDSTSALLGRGYLWFELAKPRLAVEDFSAAIKINPQHAQAFNNRGFNYRLLGKYQQALADFERAIELDQEYALAYQNKAWLLSSAPVAGIREGKQAIRMATRACELNKYQHADDLKVLAAAFAEAGEFEKAVGWQEKVVELADDEEKEFEESVAKQYRSEEPFRLEAASEKSKEDE